MMQIAQRQQELAAEVKKQNEGLQKMQGQLRPTRRRHPPPEKEVSSSGMTDKGRPKGRPFALERLRISEGVQERARDSCRLSPTSEHLPDLRVAQRLAGRSGSRFCSET